VGNKGGIIHYSGNEWQEITSPTKEVLTAIDMVNEHEGWAVGYKGAILHYKDGIWSQANSVTDKDLLAIEMNDVSEGWVLGVGGGERIILHYQDTTWQQVEHPKGYSLNSMDMLNSTEGWFLSQEGVLHYKEGKWEIFDNPARVGSAIKMSNENEGWAAGGSPAGPQAGYAEALGGFRRVQHFIQHLFYSECNPIQYKIAVDYDIVLSTWEYCSNHVRKIVSNRERELWQQFDQLSFWVSAVAMILLAGAYYLISLTTPDPNSFWDIAKSFSLNVITNLIPVILLFIGSYALLKRIQKLRTEHETEELAEKISIMVASAIKDQLSLPKESLNKSEVQQENKQNVRQQIRELQESVFITSGSKNHLRIQSDFLSWNLCTIMLWVFVPELGQDLRNAPNNRYLLAHQTDQKLESNRFALRYSKNNVWEVQFSNDKANPHTLKIADSLSPGWHHFFISWDRRNSNLMFRIDGGSRGSEQSKTFVIYTPERLSDTVTVGAWAFPYEDSYCDTKLGELWNN
jgi:hypothetical protein